MIDLNQLHILENERKVMIDCIFLEKSYKPTSLFGKGIPMGLLILTNKRLLFFELGMGKSLTNLAPKEVAMAALHFLPISGQAIDLIEYSISIIEKIKEWRKEANIDFNKLTPYAKMENSFCVSLDKISYTEKKGSTLKFLGLGMAYYKRLYLLIYIKNFMTTETYCIYCVNPENPLDAREIIKLGKWHKEINKQQKNIVISLS